MKPDWDKLGKAYKNHDSVMIVDVDCTADGQGTCQNQGVQGYPTIKYYMAGDKKGKDYQQGRDYNSLQSFVESKLNKPVCSATTKKGCAANEVSFIEKHEGKNADELKEVVKEKADELKALKAERSEAQKEMKDKEKAWKKKETALQKATAILKQLEKAAAAK